MAEALASVLLEHFAPRILDKLEEHVMLAVDAKKEVQKLMETFKTISLVLRDAEKQQFQNQLVKHWLHKFKDVAYEMEDVLDEWKTEVLRSQIEGTPPDENDPRYIKIIIKEKVSSCFCSPFSKSLKKGVLYYNIGSRIKEIRETLNAIFQEQKDFDFFKSHHEPVSDVYGISKHRETSSVLVDASNIIPRDKDKEFIVRKLLGNDETSTGSSSSSNQPENKNFDHRIISIIGLGGLGKTTLAQLIIKDDQVTAHFGKENIFWVCVSEPFDRTRIAKAIIYEATKKSTNTSDWNPLHNELIDAVKAKQFLLVLDDVWTEDEVHLNPFTDLLQLGTQGSRIMVTTRKQGVAKTMNSVQCRLGLLSDDECWSLLKRKAFVGTEINDCGVFFKIGFEIAKKCHGLPLTASILGGLLKKKKNESGWRSILNSDIWMLKSIKENYFSALLLSYNDLPSAVKRCFAYCVVFPKDHTIEKDTLIKMWMAQSFLNSSTTGERSEPESVGEQYFNDLAEGSFFQEFEKDYRDHENIVSCKMHDLVHDFAQYLSKKHNIDEHGSVESSSFPDTIKLEVKSQRTLLVSRLSPNDEHYSLINDWLGRPAELFQHLRCLRVLMLKKMEIKQLPSEIKELIHLRYLDLSQNESLIELPNSVCSLFNLQTLDLQYCRSFHKFPQGIEKLSNLKHLHLYHTTNLILSEEIGKLTSLQTLEYDIFIKSASGVSELRVLKDLNHLQGDLTIWGLGNLETANEASLAELNKKTALASLMLVFNIGEYVDRSIDASGAEMMDNVFEAFQLPPNLKKLAIYFYGGRIFPVAWFERLTNLRSLSIDKCFNLTELPALGLLQSLETLELRLLNNIKYVGLDISRFSNLKCLSLYFMKELEELDFGFVEEQGSTADARSNPRGEILSMPSLIDFTICNCPKSKTLFGGLQSLEVLQTLYISECPNLSSSSLQQLYLPSLNELRIIDCALLSSHLPASSPNLTTLEIDNASHSLPPQGLGEFKKLQYLEFSNRCSFMTSIPEDIRHLTALQTLEIKDCYWPPQKIHPDFKIEEEEDEDDEEAWSIMSHIPNIEITRGKYILKSTLTPTDTRQHSYKKRW